MNRELNRIVKNIMYLESQFGMQSIRLNRTKPNRKVGESLHPYYIQIFVGLQLLSKSNRQIYKLLSKICMAFQTMMLALVITYNSTFLLHQEAENSFWHVLASLPTLKELMPRFRVVSLA